MNATNDRFAIVMSPIPQSMDERVQQRNVVQIVDFPGSQPRAEVTRQVVCRGSVEKKTR